LCAEKPHEGISAVQRAIFFAFMEYIKVFDKNLNHILEYLEKENLPPSLNNLS
jgi:hypothetical protein